MQDAPEVQQEEPTGGRQARRMARSRRQRRFVAALLAVVGLSAVTAAVTLGGDSDRDPGAARTAGSLTEGTAGGADIPEPKDATSGPGGVGKDPEKTGLPAVPAEGGLVRTGTPDEGCFETVREYLEEWHRTGQEPDPCFTSQPASGQDQPDGVQRTYNGEKF